MNELERNSDRILVINHGRVLRFARARELVREFGGASAVLVTVEDTVASKVVLEWAESAGMTAVADDTEVRIEGVTVDEVMRPLLRHCQDSGVALAGISTTTGSLENAFLRMTESDR
jgi:ABC-type multidrug transport system ATPase subunit